jgi:hypothetical protein
MGSSRVKPGLPRYISVDRANRAVGSDHRSPQRYKLFLEPPTPAKGAQSSEHTSLTTKHAADSTLRALDRQICFSPEAARGARFFAADCRLVTLASIPDRRRLVRRARFGVRSIRAGLGCSGGAGCSSSKSYALCAGPLKASVGVL